MELALVIIVGLTVVLVVFSFGAAVYAPSSVLGTRLRALGSQRVQLSQKPAFKDRLEQALDPLSKAIPLSPADVSRTVEELARLRSMPASELADIITTNLRRLVAE